MMGMLGNKKGMASAILSEIPKIEVKDVPVGLEADFGKACEECASDLIEAVKAGEPGKVVRKARLSGDGRETVQIGCLASK